MKLKMKFLTAVCILLQIWNIPVCAAPLSPGLDIIASECNMIKSGNSETGIVFQQKDFQLAAGLQEIESITITSLPSVSSGILYLGNVPLAVNQKISANNLDKLRFVPSAGAENGSFMFSSGGEYSITCNLMLSEHNNASPVTEGNEDIVSVWTQKDIRCYGTLEAYDPEGDKMTFEIVQYPKKGLLILTDVLHGDFSYTPYSGYSGEDSFSYQVRDCYGNYSVEKTVNIMISRQDTTMVFSDMNDHWAHSAAIEMVSDGIMNYRTESGMKLFDPESSVTREDFLVMVMRSLGYEGEKGFVTTVFTDDNKISEEAKSYVSAAYNAGIIHGRESAYGVEFCPQETITRSEAAVILNNIIGAEIPSNIPVFADTNIIPVWAQSSLYALYNLGVLNGTGEGAMSPESVLNRAQTAQILFNFRKFLE